MSEGTGLPRAERVTRMSADEARELLSQLTGHPASEIHGYAYLLTRPDGSALCHGTNGLAVRDEVLLLQQAIEVTLAAGLEAPAVLTQEQIEDEVAAITDEEVEERLRQVLREQGYAPGGSSEG